MSRARGDFLGRWSARKLQARTEPEPRTDGRAEPAPPAPGGQPAGVAPAAEPDRSDEEILRELGLPDPDTLGKGDDFTAFLKTVVPARLRNRALRRLWLSNPVLANLDGLNDYEQDFTDKATVVPGMKTAYKIGRGFLRDEPADAGEGGAPAEPAAEEGAMAEAETGVPAAAEPGAAAPEPTAVPEPTAAAVPDDPAAATAAATGDAPQSADGKGAETGMTGRADAPPDEPRARRMRFRFGAG